MNYWTAAKMIGGGKCAARHEDHPGARPGLQAGTEKTPSLGVIGEEFRELEHAVLHESEERQKDEALDVAITAIRFVQEEHRHGA